MKVKAGGAYADIEPQSYFVIVGTSIAEATGKYHELHKAEDGRVRGKRIRLALVHTAVRYLEGLRVHDFVFTDSALEHARAQDVLGVLQHSVLLTNYTNHKNGEE